jgi:hypothetical protein
VGEKHKQSAIYKKCTKIRNKWGNNGINKISIEGTNFSINGMHISIVEKFKYLSFFQIGQQYDMQSAGLTAYNIN